MVGRDIQLYSLQINIYLFYINRGLHQKFVKQMNCGFKLKIKQQQATVRQDPSVRRIRTDHVDVIKKLTKQPLVQNKKIANNNHQNQIINQNGKPTKKVTAIKSVLTKNGSGYNRLTTEPSERPQHLHHQRTATAGDKIGGTQNNKKQAINIDLNSTNIGAFKKKQAKDCQYSQKQAQSLKKIQNVNQTRQLKGQNRYNIDKRVGSGTFGTVYKARDKKTLEIVAIKKVYQDKNYKNRELDILKSLNHPNVLSMKDSYFTYEQDKQYLNVIMDYYQCNLLQAISKYNKKHLIPRLKFKVYAYQLFRSLLYLRKIGIAHRDIKPQNILVNQEKLKLVMCDFGSAKQLRAGQQNLAYICSRCYRAPQLIYGNTQYTTQIDVWSTGCVLAEMFLTQPIFQGDSNIDQLVEIIKVLGCPTSNQVLEMNPDYDVNKFQLPKIKGKPWNKIFPSSQYLGQEFIDLMKNILCYSPYRRYTPLQALIHPFFDQLRDEKVYRQLQNQIGIESLFDFAKTKQDNFIQLRKLIPKWY